MYLNEMFSSTLSEVFIDTVVLNHHILFLILNQ